jgi:thiol-disulfide isomerase/thioredoxin
MATVWRDEDDAKKAAASSRRVSMYKKWLGALAALILAGFVFWFFIQGGGAGNQDASFPAPNFTLPGLSGKDISLSQFKGKVVFLDFWATWCDACREEIPDLIRLYQEKNPKGLVVLGVSVDALGKSVVQPFVNQAQIPYPVVIAGDHVPAGYDISGLPTAFLIDKNGIVRHEYIGAVSYEDVVKDINSLL